VCNPAFGLECCKSRQRFREGGFFYLLAARLRGKGFVAGGADAVCSGRLVAASGPTFEFAGRTH
jgi:hypothetical protein